MKTNQLMKREFNGTQITQRTKDSFFNATELLAVFNSNSSFQKQLYHFWENQNTKGFIEVLEKDLNDNTRNSVYLESPMKSWESTRGKGGGTWMHPYLFVKFAMWLSPELELAIIKWVYDNLIEVRIQAGDNYKEMCEAIHSKYLEIKGEKPDPYVFVKEANFLNNLCLIENGKRNELSEIELKLLNDLQKINTFLIKKGIGRKEREYQLVSYTNSFKMLM